MTGRAQVINWKLAGTRIKLWMNAALQLIQHHKR